MSSLGLSQRPTRLPNLTACFPSASPLQVSSTPTALLPPLATSSPLARRPPLLATMRPPGRRYATVASPQTPKGFNFKPGDPVEVLVDETGMRGAVFVGRSGMRGGGYTVKLDSLRLRHALPARSLRPRPPPPPAPASGSGPPLPAEHAAVDAFIDYVWWLGVALGRAGATGGKVRVCFPDIREVMEFDAADVRPHLEWVAGKWRSPDITGIPKTYAKGMQVEVSKLEDNSVVAWSPAVVAKTIWKNNLLVDYTASKCYGTALSEEIVDVKHVRPCPSQASDISFCINDEVEAFQGDRWWLGVITNVHPEFKYTFKSAHLGTEVEVDQKSLRLRYDWVDDQWEQVSKRILSEVKKVPVQHVEFRSTNPLPLALRQKRNFIDLPELPPPGEVVGPLPGKGPVVAEEARNPVETDTPDWADLGGSTTDPDSVLKHHQKHEGEEVSRKRVRGSSAVPLSARVLKKTRTTVSKIPISAALRINPRLMGRQPEHTSPEEPHTKETADPGETEQPQEIATRVRTKGSQTMTPETLVIPGRRKKVMPKALQTPPVGPTSSTQEGPDTVGTNPVITPVAQPTQEASLDNQGKATVETGIRPLPGDQAKSQVADKSDGKAGGSKHGAATQAEPVTGPSTQLVTTSQTTPTLPAGGQVPAGGPGKTLNTARPALQSYSAELSRAKELWSEMFKRSSEFDIIMKDLELKSSEQAKYIHELLSVQVRELEAKHSKQEETWRAVEAQHTEAAKVFQAQIQELEQQKATLQVTVEAAKKREATLEHKAKVLDDKLKAKASEAVKLKSEVTHLRIQLNHTWGDLYEARKITWEKVQDLAAAKAELKGLQDAVKPVVNLFKREGDDSRPLVQVVKELPTRVKEYVRAMANSCVKQVLGLVHFLLPNADLLRVADGQPGDCTDEQLDRAEEDMEEIAKSFVSGLNFT